MLVLAAISSRFCFKSIVRCCLCSWQTKTCPTRRWACLVSTRSASTKGLSMSSHSLCPTRSLCSRRPSLRVRASSKPSTGSRGQLTTRISRSRTCQYSRAATTPSSLSLLACHKEPVQGRQALIFSWVSKPSLVPQRTNFEEPVPGE
jgi:hypothetical protein